ncbi:MAG TPA: cupin domain-containing protein [Casimicrobiaceae bacterium]|nr:cupin domain-containing protein [Casimicrobiaceae bacterium]
MARSTRLLALVAAALVGAFAGALVAQSPAFNRTIIQRGDVSFPGYEAVVARLEIGPGVTGEWHTHPGDEISYVLEGESELLIAGEAPRKVAAGQAIIIPKGTAHNARNSGTAPLRALSIYVVDKSKPLASPAPAPTK